MTALLIKPVAYDPVYSTIVLVVVLGVLGLWQAARLLLAAAAGRRK